MLIQTPLMLIEIEITSQWLVRLLTLRQHLFLSVGINIMAALYDIMVLTMVSYMTTSVVNLIYICGLSNVAISLAAGISINTEYLQHSRLQ